MKAILYTLCLFLGGLIAGAIGLDWLISRTIAEPSAYIALKQAEIPPLTALLPAAGLILTLATIALAYVERRERRVFWLLLGAVALFVGMGLLTRFVFFPMNDTLMQWQPGAPPTGWSVLRERWNQMQAVRGAAAIAGFMLLLLAQRRTPGPQTVSAVVSANRQTA